MRSIAAAALRAETVGKLAPRGTHAAQEPADVASHAAVCARIDHSYRHRLQRDGSNAHARQVSHQTLELERLLRLQALQAERDELLRLRLRHRINDDTLRSLAHELDLVEAVLRHDV
jgi:CPA1 family monovalent cation:H+ antiporter